MNDEDLQDVKNQRKKRIRFQIHYNIYIIILLFISNNKELLIILSTKVLLNYISVLVGLSSVWYKGSVEI